MSSTYSAETIMLAVVPKIPAALSIVGSLAIAQNVVRSPKKRAKLFPRIMLGLSCSDITASTVYFLGTWLIPAGTSGKYGPVYGAVGTKATCTLSGFFTQFAICSPIYNATLCMYYLLMIRFGWSERRLLKIEPYLHGIPICFAFGTALTGVVLDLYGSVEWLCWVNPDPPQDDTWIFQWCFLFIPLWTCVLFVCVAMASLWWTMLQNERANDRYQHGGVRNRRQSRKVATQGLLYVVAFYITWFFPSLQRILELALNKNFFVLQFFDTALLPLQGLLNVIIYFRPRYLKYRRKHPEATCCNSVFRVAKSRRPSSGSLSSKTSVEMNGESTLPSSARDMRASREVATETDVEHPSTMGAADNCDDVEHSSTTGAADNCVDAESLSG